MATRLDQQTTIICAASTHPPMTMLELMALGFTQAQVLDLLQDLPPPWDLQLRGGRYHLRELHVTPEPHYDPGVYGLRPYDRPAEDQLHALNQEARAAKILLRFTMPTLPTPAEHIAALRAALADLLEG